jgi:hypothetical protein
MTDSLDDSFQSDDGHFRKSELSESIGSLNKAELDVSKRSKWNLEMNSKIYIGTYKLSTKLMVLRVRAECKRAERHGAESRHVDASRCRKITVCRM